MHHLKEKFTVTFVHDTPELSPVPLQQVLAATHNYLNDTSNFIKNPAIVKGLRPSCTAYLVNSGSADETLSKKAIHASIYTKDLQETIFRVERWEPGVFHLVAWEAYGRMFSKLSRARQVSVSKICHRLIQTNSRNKAFYGDSGLCVCCGECDETYGHFLSGRSQIASGAREDSLVTLQESLLDIGTPEVIAQAMADGISHWCLLQEREGESIQDPIVMSKDEILTAAIEEQEQVIGNRLGSIS